MPRAKTLEPKNCSYCNNVFTPERSPQKYCSAECRSLARRKPNRMCKQCGKEFSPKTSTQKFCSHECSAKSMTVDKMVTCKVCDKVFERPHGKPRLYCSRSCSMVARMNGMQHSYTELQPKQESTDGWRPTQDGYLSKRVGGKQMLQHRVIMEQILGRPLERHERVHHKNGNRQDNRPENLELWTGVGTSKKDPHGVRMVDKVIDMLSSLTKNELTLVSQKIKELT